MYEYLFTYCERDYRCAKFIDDDDVKIDFILNPKINLGRLIQICKYTRERGYCYTEFGHPLMYI